MITTKTPFRMSFFGGGTDIPDYFNEYGGSVLSTTFDKYCYVFLRHLPPFFDYRTEIAYSKMERVKSSDEIIHPSVRNAMKMLDIRDIRLTYEADLPAQSGLGTSSSFAAGMLNAFYALKGKYVDKEKLAKDAIYLERVLCEEAGGWQDQIAAAYGGLNRIDFADNSFEVHPIIINNERRKKLDNNLVMFFTGFTRFSSDIQKKNYSQKKSRLVQLHEIKSLVDEGERILTNKSCDLDDFGRLLDYSWQLKKKTGGAVSTSAIDQLYDKGIKAGALGGKLLGAGGGGFLLFYVQPEKKESLLTIMNDILHIPFHFECGGAQVVYYTAEDYFVEED